MPARQGDAGGECVASIRINIADFRSFTRQFFACQPCAMRDSQRSKRLPLASQRCNRSLRAGHRHTDGSTRPGRPSQVREQPLSQSMISSTCSFGIT
jgi:hypothetical protein